MNHLNQELNYRMGLLDSYTIKLDKLSELEIMEFGINELRILFNTLNEIGRENNKSLDEIKKEFFDELKIYGKVIRFRKEIRRLQSELKSRDTQDKRKRKI